MICINCGKDAGNKIICPSCGYNLSIYQRVVRISNSYYNDGLQKARVRNLSGAIVSLRRSLKFYKYNTDARNLLGLVYYEVGEVVQALSEWVISANYQSDDNAATRYLESIHQNRSQLETINQTIKKYNQAILYCQQDSRDLAIIQLKKVLSLNPKLVKGHQLLALLYIQEGQLEKAKHSLRNAGKIDTDNTTTLRYLKEVNSQLKAKGGKEKKKNEDLISYQNGNETIIVPKRFRESSIGWAIMNVLVGLVIGVLATYFLLISNVKSDAKEEAKNQLVATSDQLSADGQTIDSLTKEVESMKEELEAAQTNSEAVANQITSYEQLLNAYVKYVEGDVISTGDALASIDSSMLSQSAQDIYNNLSTGIYDQYMAALYNRGYSEYSNSDWENAVNDLLAVYTRDPSYQNGSAAYYLAQAYRKSGDNTTAKQYYQYVIDNFPNTEKSRTSQNYVNAE